MIDVTIIGAGISGLTAAWQLKQQGLGVVVLERQQCAGGNAISENINGFLMEHGPSTINAAVPEVGKLSTAVGLTAAKVELGDDVKRRYLVKNDQLHGISVHPLGFLLSNYLSLSGRARMLFENIASSKKYQADETVDQYFTRRFGKQFAKRIMDPLVGGLYAGRADRISVQSVFPKVLELEKKYGSISKGVWSRYLDQGSMPAKKLYSWRDGIGSFPKALSQVLHDHIRTGVVVRKVRACGSGFMIDTGKHGILNTRTVLMATQPHVAASLLENMTPIGASVIAEISAPPLAVVFMGFKREHVDHPLDGLGYLSASSENRAFTGVQFPSTMFAGRAPKSHVSLTAYMGGARHSDMGRMNEQDILELARLEFKDLLGTHGKSVVSKVRFWPRGIPQYTVGHQGRVDKIEKLSREIPGLFVTGNYLNGPSVGCCVAGACETAGRIHTFLNNSFSQKIKASVLG